MHEETSPGQLGSRHADEEATFRRGVVLFNNQRFWDAHEAWEQCWRIAQGAEATRLKGLIQAAAALVKWQQGNRKGLEQNWAKSSLHLAGAPDRYRKLDLVAFRVAMQQFHDRVLQGELAETPRLNAQDH